jgi:hypothetical protein
MSTAAGAEGVMPSENQEMVNPCLVRLDASWSLVRVADERALSGGGHQQRPWVTVVGVGNTEGRTPEAPAASSQVLN